MAMVVNVVVVMEVIVVMVVVVVNGDSGGGTVVLGTWTSLLNITYSHDSNLRCLMLGK